MKTKHLHGAREAFAAWRRIAEQDGTEAEPLDIYVAGAEWAVQMGAGVKPLTGPTMVEVKSVVSRRTKAPMVQLTLADNAIQMPVDTALEIAHQLLEAAEASMQDVVLLRYAQEGLRLGESEAMSLLSGLRSFRDAALDPTGAATPADLTPRA